MTRQLYIITGTSRGLGLQLAQQLLTPTHHLLCIARHEAPGLSQVAQARGAALTQWCADLADPQEVVERLSQWLGAIDAQTIAGATLINNAGVIPALNPLRDAQGQDIARALRVGLEAPMRLSSAFLAATRDWAATRKILNISSGLGRRPMASQSAYCAAKAGMDHFTRCLALDEARVANGAKVCALAPGVIDTDMQAQLRHASAQAFPDQEAFVNLKTAGHLVSASDTAERVLRYLHSPEFGSKAIADIRD